MYVCVYVCPIVLYDTVLCLCTQIISESWVEIPCPNVFWRVKSGVPIDPQGYPPTASASRHTKGEFPIQLGISSDLRSKDWSESERQKLDHMSMDDPDS